MEIANIVLEYIRALVWPIIVITILLLFRKEVIALIGRVRKLEFPGVGLIDLSKEVQEGEELKQIVVEQFEASPVPETKEKIVSISSTEASKRMIELGLIGSPSGFDTSYYKNLALENPIAALAVLRLEIEVLFKNVARGFKVQINDHDPALIVLGTLRKANAITSEQLVLAQKIWQICNAAVHGSKISAEEAISVIDMASALKDQYVRWLSWGFEGIR